MQLTLQVCDGQSIKGLRARELMRPGYAIDTTLTIRRSSRPSSKRAWLTRLFLRGTSFNGPLGYEAGGCAGRLIAGINAVLKTRASP